MQTARGPIRLASVATLPSPSRGLLSRAGKGGDDSAGQVHPPDALVLDVGNQQAAPAVQEKVVGFLEHGLATRAAVAAVTELARAGYGGDDAGAGVNLAHRRIEALGEVDIAVAVNGQAVGLVDDGVQGRTAVARITCLAVTAHPGDDARLRVHPADEMLPSHADDHVALGVKLARRRELAGRLQAGPPSPSQPLPHFPGQSG